MKMVMSPFIILLCCLFSLKSFSQSWSWAKSGGSNGLDEIMDIATDAAGNSYVTGYYVQDCQIGNITLTNSGSRDIFVAKYDTQGNVLWAHSAGGSLYDYPRSITIDQQGNCYVTGTFQGTATFGTNVLTSSGGDEMFITKYSTNGTLLWVKQEGGDAENPDEIACDAAGNIVVAGIYSNNNLTLSGTTLNPGTRGMFVVKYTPAGNLIWAKAVGIDKGVQAQGLTVDRFDNIYVTGYFNGTLQFAGFNLSSTNPFSCCSADVFLAKFDGSGNAQWAKRSTTVTNLGPEGYSVITDYAGDVYLCGYYWSSIGFDSLALTTDNNAMAMFLTKFSSSGTVLWGRTAGGYSGSGIMYDLVTDNSNNVYVYGSFYGTVNFNGISSTSLPGGNTFFARYSSQGSILSLTPVYCSGKAFSKDLYDNLYVTGIYSGSTIFGNDTLQSVNNSIDFCTAKYSQPAPSLTKLWDKTLGGNSYDRLRAIATTPNGGFVLAGTSNSAASGHKSQNSKGSHDYWLIKIDSSRNKIWDKTYGGLQSDDLMAMAGAPGDGFYLCGQSLSDSSGDKTQAGRGNLDYWIVRVDSNGNKLWDRTFGGNGEDRLIKALALPDGGCLLAGRTLSGASGDKSESSRGTWDAWLVKVDANGTKVWDKTIGGSGNDDLGALHLLANGNILAGLSSSSPVSGDKTLASYGGNDFWLVTLDGSGNILSQRIIGGSDNDVLAAIVPAADGGFLLAGRSKSPASHDKSENTRDVMGDYWVVRTDSSLQKIWDKRYGSDTLDVLYNALPTADGGFLLSGFSYGIASGDKSMNNRGSGDFWLVRLDADGEKLWDQVAGGLLDEQPEAIALLDDGSYVLGGYSFSNKYGEKSENSLGSADFWIIKFEEVNAGGSLRIARTGTPVRTTLELPSPLEGIRLYPNPTSHFVIVDLSKTGLPQAPGAKGLVQLIDNTGRIISQQSFYAVNARLQFDLRQLPAGIYFLRIETGGRQHVLKVVRQ